MSFHFYTSVAEGSINKAKHNKRLWDKLTHLLLYILLQLQCLTKLHISVTRV